MYKRKSKLKQLKSLKAPKIKKIEQKMEDDDKDEDIAEYKSDEEPSEEEENPETKRKILAKKLLMELKEGGEDVEKVLEDAAMPDVALEFHTLAESIQLKSTSSYKGHKKAITCIDVNKEGTIAYTGSKDCCILCWDITTGKKDVIHGEKGNDTGVGHFADILGISLSPDGKRLLSCGKDNTVKLWDIHNRKIITTLKGHKGPVTSVCFDTDSECCYSISADKSFKIWHTPNKSLLDTYYGHKGLATSMAPLTKDRVITCGNDELAIQWKVHSESQLLYNSRIGGMEHVSIVSSNVFAACGDEAGVCLWSLNKRTPLLTHTNLHDSQTILSMDILKGTDVIATGSYDGKLCICSLDKECKHLNLVRKIDVVGSINDVKWVNKCLYVVRSREQKYGRWRTFSEVDECIDIMRFE